MTEEKYQEEQERFTKFTEELALLSKKYGVALNVCGGVTIFDNEDLQNIVSVEYSDDSSSGDFSCDFVFKDEV